MGLLSPLFRLVGGLVSLVVLAALVVYVIDYGVEAKVTKNEQTLEGCNITVKTQVLGQTKTLEEVDRQTCLVVQAGDFVRYHVRTGHTILYNDDHVCVYDSQSGPGCPKVAA